MVREPRDRSTPGKPARFGHDPDETRKVVLARIKIRFYRSLDYLSIIVFTGVVYGCAVFADYLFFTWLLSLMAKDARESPVVGTILHFFKVGLAILAIILGCAHALRSARAQWKLDRELMKEG